MLPEIKLIYRSERGNTVKILKCIGLLLASIAMLVIIAIFEINKWPVGGSFAGIAFSPLFSALL